MSAISRRFGGIFAEAPARPKAAEAAEFSGFSDEFLDVLTQVTLLQENRKFFRYQISDWDPPVRLAIAKGDVVKTYPLA